MNILFSTTRQWNCGDEFILHGIRRLLSEFDFSYNPVIYNRHPSITPRRTTLKHRWSRPELIPFYDNSFILDDKDLIDYVIFAGTPEWYGGTRMDHLHRFIAENKIRCSFIGVGIPKKPVFSETLQFIFKNLTDVFIARDPNCFEAVKDLLPASYLPCPALFSAPANRHRVKLQKLGIVIQDVSTKNHQIPGELANSLLEEFSALENSFDVIYIAHYIEDLKYAHRLNKKVLYSAFSEDYAAIFDQFDFVISTRVHGCGIASSLGIPNLLIPHDGRYSTALKFLSHIYDSEESLIKQVSAINIDDVSYKLIKHRNDSRLDYLEIFRNKLTFLANNS